MPQVRCYESFFVLALFLFIFFFSSTPHTLFLCVLVFYIWPLLLRLRMDGRKREGWARRGCEMRRRSEAWEGSRGVRSCWGGIWSDCWWNLYFVDRFHAGQAAFITSLIKHLDHRRMNLNRWQTRLKQYIGQKNYIQYRRLRTGEEALRPQYNELVRSWLNSILFVFEYFL